MRPFELETENGFFCYGIPPEYVDWIMGTYESQAKLLLFKGRELLLKFGELIYNGIEKLGDAK